MKNLAQWILDVGHNDDCIFCGFKDKAATETIKNGDEYSRTFLECPECGKKSFVISEADGRDGFCTAEGKVLTVRVVDKKPIQ